MQKKEIAVIAIRLFALYIIVIAASALPAYLSMFLTAFFTAEYAGKLAMLSSVIGTVVYLLIGIGLWLYSVPLADFATKDLGEIAPATDEITLDRIQVIAVSIVGLLVLSSAIPSLVELIVTYLVPTSNPRFADSYSMMGKATAQISVSELATVITKLGLGLWFLMGSRGIVAFVRTFWEKGKST